ncbi:MAG: amidohydrolase family protein [Bacteroidia bacterium]
MKYTKYLLLVVALSFLVLITNSTIEKAVNKTTKAEQKALIFKTLSAGANQLINDAFSGLDMKKTIDYHTHIVGTGEGNSGNFVNKEMQSVKYPIKHLKFNIYKSAGGIKNTKKADSEYLNTLVNRIKSIPNHGKYCLLAFDKNYNENGTENLDKTEFYVPNEYVFKIAAQYPDLFIPVISIHPYRKDALLELEKWHKKGGKMVKWLPNAMSIDPSSEKCRMFYLKMKEKGMVLLTHAGEEKAVEAEEDQKLGNPLLLKFPLDLGVKVIIAHCASLGQAKVLDSKGKEIKRNNFDLFMELMNQKKYEGLLFADISAMTQYNRMGVPLLTMLNNNNLHKRLINGSDYPLPAINIIIRTSLLEKAGYITKTERKYLNEIYKFNPLLFDFVVKRTIKSPKLNRKFSNSVFMKNEALGF